MNLKNSIRNFLPEIFKGSGIEIVSYEIKGNDRKTGEPIEIVRAESSKIHILFKRIDGTIEVKIKASCWNNFKYLNQITSQESEETMIEELLRNVPISPLSDHEILQRMAPKIELAARIINEK